MVSEDLMVAKHSNSSLYSVSVGLTDTAVVPQDDRRIALIISAPLTNRVSLNWEGAAILDAGITLYPGGPPLVLSLREHGAVVCKQLRAITVVGAQILNVVSVTTIHH